MKFTSTLYSTVTNGVEYTSILDTTPAFFGYQKGSYPLTLLSKKNPKNVLMWPIRSNPQKRAPFGKKCLIILSCPQCCLRCKIVYYLCIVFPMNTL